MSTISVEQFLEELRQTATVACLNHEIWWVYKHQETRAKYIGAMNRFNPHFHTALHAHFVATIVALYRLYETRNDTYNVPRLMAALDTELGQDPAAMSAAKDLYQTEIKPLWIKVSILRNNAFGHRSTEMSVEQAFQQANVTPDQLAELIQKTKELLNNLSYGWNRSRHAFNVHAREATIRMLECLLNRDES